MRFSFAGSDELAAQIRQGAKPDVYAAANTRLPEELFEEGRVRRPVEFAGNELVIAVPAGSDEIDSIDDLAADGVRLVIGDEEVPVGSYTREVLDRLPEGQRDAILANVRSEEPDVLGITAKLIQGAADAGFLYATDVQGGRRRAGGDRAARAARAEGRLRHRGGGGRGRRRARRSSSSTACSPKPGRRRCAGPASCRRPSG